LIIIDLIEMAKENR